VIATMDDQKDVVEGKKDMGGTMRLGAYTARLKAGSIVADAYGAVEVSERHRHRYEVNNDYREQLEKPARVFRAFPGRPAGRICRAVRELHPFFVGTQAHRSSSLGRPGRSAVPGVHRGGVGLHPAERLPVELPEPAQV